MENLSGGEKTRLKLDQSFNEFNEIVFADEPTSNNRYDIYIKTNSK